jgi:hypothetical protein
MSLDELLAKSAALQEQYKRLQEQTKQFLPSRLSDHP